MNEEEIVEYWKKELNQYEYTKDLDLASDNYFGQFEEKINMISEILNLLEQKDKRIDELEKALVEEAIKSTEKINKAIKRIKETRLDYTVVGQEVLEILEE